MRKALAVIALAVVAAGVTGCTTPQPGEVGVVRNGKAWYNPFDWLDNHNIRGFVDNGTGSSWQGMGSSIHFYPVDTQQRFFKMETCGREVCPGADSFAPVVPTSDGVEVRISGTFYLNTTFNNSKQGQAALRAFDTQFSTRTFDGEHAYDGTSGWSKFLAAIIEPIVVNNMRSVVSSVRCSELVSSCALVQNQQGRKVSSNSLAGKNNSSNVAQVQTQVEQGLASDLKTTLGGAAGQTFFKNIKFNLKVVELPRRIQSAIDSAQSAFAQISQAQARVQSAQADADANKKRQQGYNACPACAAIDQTRAIPKNITTYAPGRAFSVTK